MAADAVHTTGTRVWIKDDAESWKQAEVIKLDNAILTVVTGDGKQYNLKAEDCPLQNVADLRGVEVGSLYVLFLVAVYMGCLASDCRTSCSAAHPYNSVIPLVQCPGHDEVVISA